MANFATNIKIENFKSIKQIEFNDCKRINLFIGRPNVGKSNILEALSLFSLPYLKEPNLKDIIRVEQASELFFDGNTDKFIEVYIDSNNLTIGQAMFNIRTEYGTAPYIYLASNMGTLPDPKILNTLSIDNYPYKNYFFPKEITFGESSTPFLLPPNGINLFNIVQSNDSLKQELLNLFREYGLHLVFDKSSQELKIMKGVEKGEIFLIPFSSIADSLQRLIFFKAAIKSNTDSVITFEEPEAHTYPPYIAQIAQDIIQSKTNQFFLTTHSPYVVNEMLENALDELAIFLIDFKDGQTVAKRLTQTELDEVYNNGIDLFFNNELFL